MSERAVEEQWLELDGRQVHCCTLPPGPQGHERPPLLLIHGITCCIRTWEPFLRDLARRDDAPAVVVPDLPAHGKSAPPGRYLGIADFADWSARLLAQLELPRADVMGHSMGGQIALTLAHRHPESVRRLVLLGPTTGARHVSAFRNFVGLLRDSTREPFAYNQLLQTVFWRMGPRRYLRTVREMQADDAFVRACQVSFPALVLQGERDAIIPEHVAKDLAETLSRGAYAQIGGAAHAAQFTHPALTAEHTLRFLHRAESPAALPVAPPASRSG